MSKIILPIDTKSLYQNILNDNLSGHTATVATPLKQGNSYNNELGKLLEIKEKEIDFQEKPELINEMLKNSKSKNIIKKVFVFDKVAVNGEVLNNKCNYCIYIKEEVDPSKAQYGRLKVHYPINLKYEDVDLTINNKEIINLISDALNNYAYLIKSFEYDTKEKILNFNALVVGENKIPYSKVFINEKGDCEISYFWNDDKTDVLLKARPDKVVDDIIIDAKTTAKPNPNIKKRLENANLCIKLFDQLGLSPVARARAGIEAANANKGLDVFKKLMERNDD